MILSQLANYLLKHPSVEADIAPALTIDTDAPSFWDLTTDVLVVGCGGAGVTAALEASEHNTKVLMLDRYNAGGSTKISGGILYAGGGTAIQQQCQVEDSADNMYGYLKHEVQDAVSPETLKDFCDNSVDNFNWVSANGVEFHPSQCPFKTSYPPNDYYFYYSGNEFFPPYTDDAKPAARGHRAHRKGVSGAGFFEPLLKSALDKGIKLQTQSRVKRLIKNKENDIIGVEAMAITTGSFPAWVHKQLYALMIFLRYQAMYVPLINRIILTMLNMIEGAFAKPLRIKANKGVILSTGGHYLNKPLIEKHAPDYLPGMALGTVGDDGSGLGLGQSVKAATGLMESVSAWRFANPPEAFIRGVLVDSQGQRICNEMLYGAQIAERMIKHHNGKGYLIIDASLFSQALKELGPGRSMWFQAAAALMYLFLERKKGQTLNELARKLNMPFEELNHTIHDYNAILDGDQPDPMGKPRSHITKVQEGPYYALNVSYDSMIVPCPSLSLGGLKVDEKTGQVLSVDNQPISGLYAAGRSAVGIASRSYVSGLSIADCVYSGRRAGKHAAGADCKSE